MYRLHVVLSQQTMTSGWPLLASAKSHGQSVGGIDTRLGWQAALKALPTPEELVARGKADCQAFLNDLATSEKEAFFAARRSMWGQETRCRSVAENTQVIIDCVLKQMNPHPDPDPP